MSVYADTAWSRELSGISPGQVSLWTIAAAAMLAAHLTAAWWATRQVPEPLADLPAQAAVMIDLAPTPMAPPTVDEQVATEEADSVASEAPPTLEPLETTDTAALVPEELEPVPDAPPPVEEQVVERTEIEPVPDTPLEMQEPEDIQEVEPDTVTPVAEEPVEEIVEPVEEEVAQLENVEVPLPTVRPEPPKVEPEPRRQAKAEPKRPIKRETVREKPKRDVTPRRAAPKRETIQARANNAPAERAAAPSAGASQRASVSPARWQSRLRSHLERRKRYPSEARRERRQGTASVRFSIDAGGNVGAVSLTRSSGYPELDQEAVSMVRRSSPVPAPPPGVSRTIVVPVNFSLR